jgi:hypothetical protein
VLLIKKALTVHEVPFLNKTTEKESQVHNQLAEIARARRV